MKKAADYKKTTILKKDGNLPRYALAALLPMKGHSERIPKKNMKNFNGKPLYHHIMGTLLQSKFIDKVVVNTDSEVIAADVAKNFPTAIVVMRPTAICGDFVPMNKIIEHDINLYSAHSYLQTHATNPQLTTRTIDKAISTFRLMNNKHDSLFSVTKHQSRFYDQDNKPINHDTNQLLRTQDLPPLYEENSCFYLFTTSSFLVRKNRIGNNPYLFAISKIEGIDIDDPEDFILAQQFQASVKSDEFKRKTTSQ